MMIKNNKISTLLSDEEMERIDKIMENIIEHSSIENDDHVVRKNYWKQDNLLTDQFNNDNIYFNDIINTFYGDKNYE